MNANRTVPFTYADIFRVVQYTLDHRRLIIQAVGLLLALLALFGFFALGYQTQGSLNFLPWFCNLAGVISFYLIIMIFAGPVTYLILEEIKTGRRASVAGSLKKGLRYGLRLALAPLGVLTFLLAAGIILVLLTCLGMTPDAGPVIWALLIIPQFILSLLLVIGTVTLLAETLLLPSIIIEEKIPPGQAFAVLLRLMRRRFLTFWGYSFTALFLTLVYFLLFTLVILGALAVLYGVSFMLLGDMPGGVLLAMPAFFHELPSFIETSISFPPGLPAGEEPLTLAGYLAGFSLLFIYVAWLSYPILYGFNSGVIIYLALKNKDSPTSPPFRTADYADYTD